MTGTSCRRASTTTGSGSCPHNQPQGATLSCRVAGSAGVVVVLTSVAVVPTDGSWHQVGCARVGDQVSVQVDGSVVASGAGPTGDVSSARNYLLGSKGTGQPTDPDQYLGLLDDAFVMTDGAAGGGPSTPPPPDSTRPPDPPRGKPVGRLPVGDLKQQDRRGHRMDRTLRGVCAQPGHRIKQRSKNRAAGRFEWSHRRNHAWGTHRGCLRGRQ